MFPLLLPNFLITEEKELHGGDKPKNKKKKSIEIKFNDNPINSGQFFTLAVLWWLRTTGIRWSRLSSSTVRVGDIRGWPRLITGWVGGQSSWLLLLLRLSRVITLTRTIDVGRGRLLLWLNLGSLRSIRRHRWSVGRWLLLLLGWLRAVSTSLRSYKI